MNKVNTVKNYDTLIKGIAKPTEGQCIYCEEEQNYYYYHENEWRAAPKNSNGQSGLEVGLYDLNAQFISQLPTLDAIALDEAAELINEMHANELNRFYMLLCKEQSYFTALTPDDRFNNEFKTIGEAVITLCSEIGDIKSVYQNSAGDIDIWMLPEGQEIWCLHLFPYDMGVVHFG